MSFCLAVPAEQRDYQKALGSIVDGAAKLYASSGPRITEAIDLLVDRAKASGDIRAEVEPNDLLRALVGFAYANLTPGGGTDPGWRASTLRLIDLLMAGLKPGR